jgi:hypothetical protein
MDFKDILISAETAAMLRVNGRDDCNRGIEMSKGWKEVAELCGFDPNSRTPASEAYEDGYYSGTFKSLKGV